MTEILSNKTVIVTSPTISGWKITQVMGIVTGEAVNSCDLDYETPGTMLMVAASGTAVRIEPENEV